MYRKKHTKYRVWYDLKFQASTGGLETYPPWILQYPVRDRVTRVVQEGGIGLIGTGGVATSRKVDYYSRSRIQRNYLWMFVSPGSIEKPLNSSTS